MSDLYALAYMGSIALTCGLTVALGEYLYRCLTKQSHGDRPDSPDVVGDVPFVPAELKAFHSATNTEGEQLNHGAR